MSAADVKFYTLDRQPCPADEDPARFGFRCPVRSRGAAIPSECGGLLIAGATAIKRSPDGSGGGRPQWDWNGDRVAPTFSPSIHCHGCWHGYIENGRCVTTQKVDEPS